MYSFLLQTLVMLSLATMVYLVARTIPRVSALSTPSTRKNKINDFFDKIPWHKIDEFLSMSAEKVLRKIKVFILKLDNSISKHLEKSKVSDVKKDIIASDILDKPIMVQPIEENKTVENKSENTTIEQ